MLDQEVEADRRPAAGAADGGPGGLLGRFHIRDDFRRAQLAIAALFWSLGFQYGTWASRLPTIKARLGLSTDEVGLMLMACGAGAAASFPLVAVLTKRLGSRQLACLSGAFLALLLPALAVAPDYPVALVIVCLDGVAVGCLNVAMNAQGAAPMKSLSSPYRRLSRQRRSAPRMNWGCVSSARIACRNSKRSIRSSLTWMPHGI